MQTAKAADLPAALQALYCSTDSNEAHAADLWLRAFSTQPGAWQPLAALLTDPAAADYARSFAATALRHCCQRHADVLHQSTLAYLAPLLSQQLAGAAIAGCWHICNQLAAALATLAVRSPDWQEADVLPQLISLVQGALAGCSGVSNEHRQLVLLRLLNFLAEAAGSKEVGMHPQRRAALRTALVTALQPLHAIKQALSAGSTSAVQLAALQLLQAWCALGHPPAGAENSIALWHQLHLAALHPDLGSHAAEALAALYATCHTDNTRIADAKGSLQQAQPCQLLLQELLAMLPAFASELQQALSQAQQPHQQSQLLFAALAVLGAAARAADSQAGSLGGTAALDSAASAVQLAADLALVALQQQQMEVILAALQHWDEQLERWKEAGVTTASSPAAQASAVTSACNLHQRSALLIRLCGGLLQRMTLPLITSGASFTADARDLPAPLQLVRREAADTFRAAADCLGPQQTRQQLLVMARDAHSAGAVQEQECCLYAVNLIWSRQRTQQAQQAAEEVQQAVTAAVAALSPATPKLAGTALTLVGGMAEQLPVLGRQATQPGQANGGHHDSTGNGLLGHLLDTLLQLVRLPSDEKLSRNAATCCYRLSGTRQLAAVLSAQHPGWGEALCGCFVAGGGMQQRPQEGEDLSTAQLLLVTICRLSAAAAISIDGAGSTASASQPCSELLRQLLVQMAAAADVALNAATAAALAGNLQKQQWQWHLEQAALQLEYMAVAIEAVASHSRCTNPTQMDQGGGTVLNFLPELLSSTEEVLRRAAAAAAACSEHQATPASNSQAHQRHAHQQQQQQQHLLVQAVCHLASALAPTPAASLGLDLMHPLIASPQHPCVLRTLARLVCSSTGYSTCSTSSGSNGQAPQLQQLQPFVSRSLQAASAEHASDSDWQPAILALGASCVQYLPAVAADEATLSALLCTAQHGMRSFHRDACEQAAQFAEALCCVGCLHQQANCNTVSFPFTLQPGATAAAGPQVTADYAAHPSAARTARTAAAQEQHQSAQQHLRQCLDAGLGSQLLLGLLLAASGAMPAYMMLPVAETLHRIWLAVGVDRFGTWLREAALHRANDSTEAPWLRWKGEAAAAALDELLSQPCFEDVRRFKRQLKAFCGGKKKGTIGAPPARGGG